MLADSQRSPYSLLIRGKHYLVLRPFSEAFFTTRQNPIDRPPRQNHKGRTTSETPPLSTACSSQLPHPPNTPTPQSSPLSSFYIYIRRLIRRPRPQLLRSAFNPRTPRRNHTRRKFRVCNPRLRQLSANASFCYEYSASSFFPACQSSYVLATAFGNTFANAAMQPAKPTARPPMRKSACPPNVAKRVAGNVAASRVIFATEPHVSFTPTTLACLCAICAMVSESKVQPVANAREVAHINR